MKISLEWLGEYLPGALDAQAAADALTHGGLPVELIETVGDDTVIDVEVTSNRTDCFCHVGLAREIGALTGGNFAMPKIAVVEAGDGRLARLVVAGRAGPDDLARDRSLQRRPVGGGLRTGQQRG